MQLFKTKNAQATDRFAMVVTLFTFGAISIFLYYILNAFITEYSTTPFYDAPAQQAATQFLAGIAMYDWVIVILMFVLIAGIGVVSYRIASPPVFFVITLITGFIEGLVSYIFNVVFSQIFSESVFTTTLLMFPKTVLICTNLHWVALAGIIVGSIALYAKKPEGQFLS